METQVRDVPMPEAVPSIVSPLLRLPSVAGDPLPQIVEEGSVPANISCCIVVFYMCYGPKFMAPSCETMQLLLYFGDAKVLKATFLCFAQVLTRREQLQSRKESKEEGGGRGRPKGKGRGRGKGKVEAGEKEKVEGRGRQKARIRKTRKKPNQKETRQRQTSHWTCLRVKRQRGSNPRPGQRPKQRQRHKQKPKQPHEQKQLRKQRLEQSGAGHLNLRLRLELPQRRPVRNHVLSTPPRRPGR